MTRNVLKAPFNQPYISSEQFLLNARISASFVEILLSEYLPLLCIFYLYFCTVVMCFLDS